MSDDTQYNPNSKVDFKIPKETTMKVTNIFLKTFIMQLIKNNNKRYEFKEGDPKLFDIEVAYKYACEIFNLNFPPFSIITLPLNWKHILDYKLNASKIKAVYNISKEKAKRKKNDSA